MKTGNMVLFSGLSNVGLATEIADYVGVPLSPIELKRFKDNEVSVKLKASVRGQDVFLIQSTSNPANEHIMELLLMVDAAMRANRVLTMDLHADQIQGFFDISVDNLFASPVVIDYIKKMNIENVTVVSPDTGGVDRARFLAKNLDTDLAIIDKRRPEANVAEVMNIIGDVKGRNCIIIDDMVDTGGSITKACQALKESGALDVYCVFTHPVLSDNAIVRLDKANFKEIIFTNTIKFDDFDKYERLKVLSMAPLFGEAIRRIHNSESVSSLFL